MKRFLAGLVAGLVLATGVSGMAQGQVVKLIVNGREVTSDVPPQILNGRTMVPARPLAEALGAKVEWNAENWAVVVTGQPQPKVTNSGDSEPPAVLFQDGKLMLQARLLAELLAKRGATFQFTDGKGIVSAGGRTTALGEPVVSGSRSYFDITPLLPESKTGTNVAPSPALEKDATAPAAEPSPPAQLGTTLSQAGVSVTVDRVEYLTTDVQPNMPYEFDVFFTVSNGDTESPLRGMGRFNFVLSDGTFEKEFNSLGYGHIGDAVAWVYPGKSRQAGYKHYFHSNFQVVELRWTGTFDNNRQVNLGPWKVTP